MGNTGAGIAAILMGIFCAFCAYKDFNWFMGSSKARLFVRLFGRNGARLFYIGLGVFFMVIGLVLIFVG